MAKAQAALGPLGVTKDESVHSIRGRLSSLLAEQAASLKAAAHLLDGADAATKPSLERLLDALDPGSPGSRGRVA